MPQRVIKFCYRKIINQQSAKPWDKMVFDDSYAEYRMQVQNFEQHREYPSYGTLLHHQPEAAALPQRVAPSVSGYVQQLNNIMPDILNNLGRRFLNFGHFQLEIINSHFEQKEKHQVAINFFSAPYFWHDTIGSSMLISAHLNNSPGETFTEMLPLPPFLSICNIEYLP